MGMILKPGTAYEGLVATRCNGTWHGQIDTTNKQLMARSVHYARDDIVSLKLILPNVAVVNGVETGPGAPATCSAGIEHITGPLAGTSVQVTWSGSSDGTIPNGDISSPSDPRSVSIAAGTSFAVRPFMRCSAGIVYSAAQSNLNFISGDQIKTAVSGLTDQTMTGDAITGGRTDVMFFPVTIIATTSRGSVCIIGGSDVFGINCNPTATGDKGLAASIGPWLAYACLAVPGERAGGYNSNSAIRRKVYQWVRHVVTPFGENDLADGVSAATLRSRMTTMGGRVPAPVKFWPCTIPPGNFAVDNPTCSTLAGQTFPDPIPAIMVERFAYSDSLRDGSYAPGAGYFELADVFETSRNSNLFKVSPQPYSIDCQHWDTYSANTVLPASGAMDLTRLSAC